MVFGLVELAQVPDFPVETMTARPFAVTLLFEVMLSAKNMMVVECSGTAIWESFDR